MTDHIVSNQVRCLSCGDDIFSVHVHDFVQCSCGKVAVDGGNEYIRRVGHRGMYEEKSIVLPNELVEDIQNQMTWGLETGRNSLGLTYAALRAIRDAGYQVVPKEIPDAE